MNSKIAPKSRYGLHIIYSYRGMGFSKLVDGKSFCTVVFGLPLQLVIVQIMLFCKYSCIFSGSVKFETELNREKKVFENLCVSRMARDMYTPIP